MDPGLLLAPLDALDHPVMKLLMQQLAKDGYSELQRRETPTYTSVVTTNTHNDERYRNWVVARKIASIHLDVSQLPDPMEELLLEPSEWAIVTTEQYAAAAKVREWWLEGSQAVMMRLFNLGLSRLSTAAHLYALDFLLWMRGKFVAVPQYNPSWLAHSYQATTSAGYAIPSGDFSPVGFYFTKPSAHVGPFSSEYDNFFAERFRERIMAGHLAIPSNTPSPISPGGPQQVANTSTNTEAPVRDKFQRVQSKAPPTTSTAPERRGPNRTNLDAAIQRSSAEIDQPSGQLRSVEEATPAPVITSVTEARPSWTAKLEPSSSFNSPILRRGDINQPPRWETMLVPPATSSTETPLTSTVRPSSGLDMPDLKSDENQPPKQKARSAPPVACATEANSTSSAGSNRDGNPYLISAGINQSMRGGGDAGRPDIGATAEAYPKSTSQPSRGVNKRTRNESDAIAEVPPPKRSQQGLPLRTLASMGFLGRHEVYQPFGTEQQLQASTVPQNTTQAIVLTGAAATHCGNTQCNSPHHKLVDCFGPVSASGFLEGCPFHNTQLHDIDACGYLSQGQLTREELFNVLVTRRANLPPFKTAISILALAATMGRLDRLADTMPLDRRTVTSRYAQMRLWVNPNRTRLFRDPRFPSDPLALMETLYRSWQFVVQGLTRQDHFSGGFAVPDNFAVFRTAWVSELVPYSKAFETVRVRGRGVYPFIPKPDLLVLQKQHREMAKESLLEFQLARLRSQREGRN
ncbi:hypothetical protein SMACR_06081 [Sordaria macrospora]|uniref:WGS project CABT00000000 data, contig 2.32 n=2 Tax=Sordaria macrospora TaxID=5147 RepID=F7W601_SORMK|nr:uncharacterized protein SMAC_06081 [Sordaria macrospora k-hell]KAA8631415.1 hypothetical protein SMACR_06081 [Sordaria macrospora]KAH7628169.1 hypothetical protein B0T09DRAFT_359462 [Sordaria sp. MPI-SDFR-AT-0083]WPJ65624.1 hypothetical protein SMAC4_06081 [Sordaria macrospora]CCC12939.1 unnamed protein product [Sordaria macrospora k-hell]